jgi:hypothetical protein
MSTQANTVATLNRLEWQAVSIALNDAATCGCGSITKRASVTKFLQSIFQVKPITALADPKLEAVRRFVCETKQRGPSVSMHEAALAAHGYNGRQIAMLALVSK